MAGVRGKNTRPELALRKALHAKGFRFRLHGRGISGRPDLVFPKYHALVFVHGCFWHRHPNCKYTTTPSSRREFWAQKFEANVARDARHRVVLRHEGWRIAVVWECSLRQPELIMSTTALLTEWLVSDSPDIEIGVGRAGLQISETWNRKPP